ncbi:hypothetical protein [Streptomyces sp. NBC_00211]
MRCQETPYRWLAQPVLVTLVDWPDRVGEAGSDVCAVSMLL